MVGNDDRRFYLPAYIMLFDFEDEFSQVKLERHIEL